ncbi:ATP-dependent transcriptional regulator [Aliivibrio finisterrensis]|uniref:ATP-dependent transcriptional regulator n=1 Tax=Aliivibrio finisterrensis TaxID=511998 RepID=A0A6N6RPV4_9GAMM|nr:ATP-dependent transcriptional regulator [Aliivibrio finisterrensis]KAB2823564.1 ATP-dependent transcriptional regulator [Aliivibrio finisterrensis]
MKESKNKIISNLKALELIVGDDASNTLKEAKYLLDLSEKNHFKYGVAYSKLIISIAHWHLMDYQTGFKSAKEVLQLQQELENDNLLPLILHTLALHSWGQAKLFSAQQYWIKALEQSSLIGNHEIEIEALIGLGNVWRMTNCLEQANSTHNIAAQRGNYYRMPHLEAKAYILQAWDSYLLCDYQAMLPILFKAEKLLTDNSNLTWKAEIYDFRGLAFLGLDDLDSAQKCCSLANQLAIQHDLIWMKAHSAISLARIASAQSHFTLAYQLLTGAEVIAQQFDKGELRSQICLEQSRIAELTQNFELALYSYKRYRQYEIALIQEQSSSLGRDKTSTSKERLDIRAKNLIQRIEMQLKFNSMSSLTYLLPRKKWYAHLKSILTNVLSDEYHLIMITDPSEDKINNLMLLGHHYCKQGDSITRLNDTEIAILINENKNKSQEIAHSISTLLSTYPWSRYSLNVSIPSVTHFSLYELNHHATLSQMQMEII